MEKKIIDYALECIEAKNCLPTTKQTADKLGVDEKEVERFKRENAKYAEFVKLRKRFTGFDSERKNGFGGFKAFYKWYDAQEPKCHYCGTTESNLKKLFKINDDDTDKPLYSKKISFTATLQVDRKDSHKGYNEKNCVLACAFCNNAKSDMVRYKDLEFFKEHFKEFVQKFYTHLDSTIKYLD